MKLAFSLSYESQKVLVNIKAVLGEDQDRTERFVGLT
jgi:hypothetical protein